MQAAVYSLVTPDYRPAEAAELVAEIGYAGIEWTVDYSNALWDEDSNWHIDTRDLERSARTVRRAARENGLQVVALGTRCGCGDLDEVRRYLRMAELVDAPAIRVMASSYDGSQHYDELLSRARADYGAIEKEARRTGIRALVEIHNGLICPSASAMRRLLDGRDPDHVGVIFDPGNMVREGLENWRMAVQILGPYLAHVHVKDGGWFRGGDGAWEFRNMSLAEGMVDWPQVIDALGEAGYDGFLSIEDFRGGWAQASEEFPTREKLQEDYDYLSSLL